MAGGSQLQGQALEIHQRLLLDQPTASLDATEWLLAPLTARLRAKWPTLDPDTCHDAATEVFVQYLQAPSRYDPRRSSLLGWLTMQAHRDLINDHESKQKAFERRWAVESSLPTMPGTDEPAKLEDYLPSTEAMPNLELSPVLKAIRDALPDEKDRRLLWLVGHEGSRSTDEAAEILGLMHLPLAERTTEVRRNKDRIMRRLRRVGLDRGDD